MKLLLDFFTNDIIMQLENR